MTGLGWAAATVLLGAALAYVSWVDAHTRRLPDAVTLPLITAGLALSTLLDTVTLPASAIGGGAAFALFGILGQMYFVRHGREGLGLGDAKLFAAAGTWLGWQGLPAVLLIASCGALLFALVLRRGAEGIAFGPWLSLGFFVMWLAQH